MASMLCGDLQVLFEHEYISSMDDDIPTLLDRGLLLRLGRDVERDILRDIPYTRYWIREYRIISILVTADDS